jgi:hypothetical protein
MQYQRQMDIVSPDLLQCPILLIGCGAVGGWTALTLSKMGAGRLSLWDPDVVEEVNISSQLYGVGDVGRLKVEALGSHIDTLCHKTPTGDPRSLYPYEFPPDPEESNWWRLVAPSLRDEDSIAIVAVDSMTARSKIWRSLRKIGVRYVIDPRMGAEVARIYTVDMRSRSAQRAYNDTLYTSDEALQAPCTGRATAYCANGLSSFITAKVVKLVTGREWSPFLTFDFRNALLFSSSEMVA